MRECSFYRNPFVTEFIMRLVNKIVLAASATLLSIPSAYALTWDCGVPEIDGPAGVSALAVLISAGVMAYERCKS
jgi:hypothetical protein